MTTLSTPPKTRNRRCACAANATTWRPTKPAPPLWSLSDTECPACHGAVALSGRRVRLVYRVGSWFARLHQSCDCGAAHVATLRYVDGQWTPVNVKRIA